MQCCTWAHGYMGTWVHIVQEHDSLVDLPFKMHNIKSKKISHPLSHNIHPSGLHDTWVCGQPAVVAVIAVPVICTMRQCSPQCDRCRWWWMDGGSEGVTAALLSRHGSSRVSPTLCCPPCGAERAVRTAALRSARLCWSPRRPLWPLLGNLEKLSHERYKCERRRAVMRTEWCGPGCSMRLMCSDTTSHPTSRNTLLICLPVLNRVPVSGTPNCHRCSTPELWLEEIALPHPPLLLPRRTIGQRAVLVWLWCAGCHQRAELRLPAALTCGAFLPRLPAAHIATCHRTITLLSLQCCLILSLLWSNDHWSEQSLHCSWTSGLDRFLSKFHCIRSPNENLSHVYCVRKYSKSTKHKKVSSSHEIKHIPD